MTIATPLRNGSKIPGTRFRIERCLGKGGSGFVYEAKPIGKAKGKSIAVKVFAKKKNFEHEKDFHNQVKGMRGLVRKLGIHGTKSEYPSISYEYSSIGDLQAYWRARGRRPFSVLQVGTIMRQLVTTTAALHRRDFVHGDLKPANILVFEDSKGFPNFNIADVGSASKVRARFGRPQVTGQAKTNRQASDGYTDYFAAPEQRRGDRAGKRSDIFSLGMLWFQLLVNELEPITSGRPLGNWVLRVKSLPQGKFLVRALELCLAELPDERFRDANQMLDWILCLMGDWCEVIQKAPDPQVVKSAEIRKRIRATKLPWRVRHRIAGIEMLLVPPGEFQMGFGKVGFASPIHSVTISKPFYIGDTPVTVDQWSSSLPDSELGLIEDDWDVKLAAEPAVLVSWFECKHFCELNLLCLPTEAQWEYAAGACQRWAPYWDMGDYAAFESNRARRTRPPSPLGTRWRQGYQLQKPNPIGVKDMVCLVMEWCSDCCLAHREGKSDKYHLAADRSSLASSSQEHRQGKSDKYYWACRNGVTDPMGLPLDQADGQTHRVIRGNAWWSMGDCFPWNRDSGHPVMRSDSVGFRVVRNLGTSEGF